MSGEQAPRANERIYSLYFRSAQAPDPASRVVLSNRRDSLGVPQIELFWSVKHRDVSSIHGWIDVLARDVQDRGLGRVVLPPTENWHREIIGGPHHMGTTRMSDTPQQGVVDRHCRVHSVSNLYIAGGSVFATCGYANPTFTIIALALRLADTLRDRLRDGKLGCAPP
jgi:choline dehydrogenase-like flavoprotein